MLDIPPDREMADACRKGNTKRIGELIEWGVDPAGAHDGERFLTTACKHGQNGVAKQLMRAGAKPVVRDLMLAVLTGNTYLCDNLADELHFSGVEVDYWLDGSPILTNRDFLATAEPRIIEWLLGQGADPTQRNRNGTRPAEAAAKAGADPEVIALLS